MATQREEVVIQLGIDNSSISKGLSGAKEKISEWSKNIKTTISQAFGALGASLSIGGAILAFKSLNDYVRDLTRLSESTGLSSGLTQDLLNLGKAAGVGRQEIESMMQSFATKLAPGQNPDEALNAIADKMASIPDPASRAKIAMDAFGNSGIKLIPILSQGSEGLKKIADQYGRISETNLESVERAREQLEKFGNQTTVGKAFLLHGAELFGKSIFNIVKNFFSGGKSKTIWQAFHEEVDKEVFEGIGKDVDRKIARDSVADAIRSLSDASQQQKMINDGLAAQAELQEHLRGIEYNRADTQTKIFMLTEDVLIARRKLLEMGNAPEKERVKLLIKIADLEDKIFRLKQADKPQVRTKAAAPGTPEAALDAINSQIYDDQRILGYANNETTRGNLNKHLRERAQIFNGIRAQKLSQQPSQKDMAVHALTDQMLKLLGTGVPVTVTVKEK